MKNVDMDFLEEFPGRGTSLYHGLPIPTKEAYYRLGTKGLFQIHIKIQDETYLHAGAVNKSKDFGVPSVIEFKDNLSGRLFQVIDKTDETFDDWIAHYQVKDDLEFPEILDDEEDCYLVREITGEVDKFREVYKIVQDN